MELESEQGEEAIGSLESGAIGSTLIIYLNQYVRANKLGRVFESRTTFKFKGKKPNRQPDVAFVATNRLPTNWRQEADFAPDFAAEVVSKNDKAFEIEAKAKQYQKSKVRLIWIIHPYSKTIYIYRLATGLVPQVIGPNKELDGEDVVPGFKLKVNELFAGIPVDDDEDYDTEENETAVVSAI